MIELVTKVIRGLTTVVLVTLLVFLAFATAVTSAFVVVDIAARAGPDAAAASWAVWLRNRCISLAGQDPGHLSGEELAGITSSALAYLYALVSVWFAVLTFIAYRKHRADVQYAAKEAAIVETYPVRTIGLHDLKTMYDFYYNAESITVFSGDFDWILKHKKLRTLIEGLAEDGKILLVSYKTVRDIKSSWNRTAGQDRKEGIAPEAAQLLLEKLRPRFRFHDRKVKFTLIEIGSGQESFLSLVKGYGGTRNDVNIGIHSAKGPHAASLLRIMKNIGEVERCEELRDWDRQMQNENNVLPHS